MNRLEYVLSENITLGNIAEGQLESFFQAEYPKLIKGIKPGQKGSIGIKIDFSKNEDEPEIILKASVSTKYPKEDYTFETKTVTTVVDDDCRLKIKPKNQPGLF